MMTRTDAPGPVITFILGVGIGAIAALLFAPKAGEKVRADIAAGVNDGINQVRSTGKDLKQRTQNLVDLAKDHVQVAIEVGNNAFNQAKKA
jgi:gas vesicle protein